jgi:hypothetical protein
MRTSEHPIAGEKIDPEQDAHIGPFGCPVGMSKKSLPVHYRLRTRRR